MPLNPYFENYNYGPEQNLIEDMVVESIEMVGMRVYYLPRNILTRDAILREGDIVQYDVAMPITVLFKSVDGWGGDSNFLSKWGPEIRATLTFEAAMRSFRTETTQFRPMEGDLIYLPMNGKLFTIQFVNHETTFYDLGKLYSWDIPCALFEYSSEKFNTGLDFIDAKYNQYSADLSTTHIQDSDGTDITSELNDFFQDESYSIPDNNSQNDVFKAVAKKTIDRSEIDPFGVDD